MVPVRDAVLAAERDARFLPGTDERFSGWGLMGLTFQTGDVLATRRFPASSIGPGYTSVWYRTPAGEWTFYADVPSDVSCSRFFGSAIVRSVTCPIVLDWIGESELHVEVPQVGLSCDIAFAETWASRAMNLMSRSFPERAWRSPSALRIAAGLAGPLLGAGNLAMSGRTPNHQSFIANPRTIWVAKSARLTVDGRAADVPGPLTPQPRLGDFYIPQRGLLALGNASFERFDAERHSARTSQF